MYGIQNDIHYILAPYLWGSVIIIIAINVQNSVMLSFDLHQNIGSSTSFFGSHAFHFFYASISLFCHIPTTYNYFGITRPFKHPFHTSMEVKIFTYNTSNTSRAQTGSAGPIVKKVTPGYRTNRHSCVKLFAVANLPVTVFYNNSL